jgi:crotonobetainyl-CoA:carnitine CoA-transferase CaiB-like acyl-CoA transferase
MSALKSIRVIEFCQIAAGPFAGMLLADMGADVKRSNRPRATACATGRRTAALGEHSAEILQELGK